MFVCQVGGVLFLGGSYEVFGPARFVSGLFSSNLAAGFLIANAISRRGYFPGLLTAPLLLIFAVWLAALEIKRGAVQPPDLRGMPVGPGASPLE